MRRRSPIFNTPWPSGKLSARRTCGMRSMIGKLHSGASTSMAQSGCCSRKHINSVCAMTISPTQLGPTIKIFIRFTLSYCLATTQKQAIKLLHAQLGPGWSPVITLAATLSYFHIAQQGIHFTDAQLAVGADRAVASHGSQQFVDARLNQIAAAIFHQLRQHRLDRKSTRLNSS